MENEKQIEAQKVNDNDVIDRVLRGEKGAYELIIRKYNQRLYRIVRLYLKNEDEIEDVIQESYVKAYEKMSQFEKRSSFSTWLIRIAINEALAHLKRQKRLVSFAPDQTDDSGMPREIAARSAKSETPIGEVMNAELKEILERAVDRLPEKYRTVFVMREMEGLSIAETSESLDISGPNVKVRLNRAKEMLRETISDFYHDVEVFHFDLVRCDRIVQNVMHRLGEIHP